MFGNFTHSSQLSLNYQQWASKIFWDFGALLSATTDRKTGSIHVRKWWGGWVTTSVCENEINMKSHNSSPGKRQGDITLLNMKHYAHRHHQHHVESTAHGKGERKVAFIKMVWFRMEVGSQSQKSATTIPWKEIKSTFSRCWGPLESFFSSHCGRNETAGWPITWVAGRTVLWNSDYYLQCGTSSAEPSNPRACRWSCGMLLTSVIWRDPPRQIWLGYGSLCRRGRRFITGRGEGWLEGRRIRYGFAGYGHVILVLSD